MNICYNCFKEHEGETCPDCGYKVSQDTGKYPLALPHGTVLAGRYIIGRVLGQGGFGITYVAQNYQTKEIVAIKEYYPEASATRIESKTVSSFTDDRAENFIYGKECFLNEAKTLAEFIGNPNIVRVYSYFEENNTAYFVMEYITGISLLTHLKNNGGKISVPEAKKILFPVMDALSAVHGKGIIHRDISPDNIYISADNSIKLLDFGAARYSLGDKSRSLDVVLKHGYAPKEQYTRRGRQGPYTDIYSLAATFYRAITGKVPPDSIERMDEDDLIYPNNLGIKISEEDEDALVKALSVYPIDRFQSMNDFKNAMSSESYSEEQKRPEQEEEKKEEQESAELEIIKKEEQKRPELETIKEEEQESAELEKKKDEEQNSPEIQETQNKKGKNKKPLIIAVIAAVVILIISGVIIGAVVSNNSGGKDIKVPNCVGLAQAEAVKSLKNAGIKYNTEKVHSDTVKEGVVIDQSLKAGTMISADKTLTLTISSGKQILYPDLVGKTQKEAEADLTKLGLKFAVGSEKYSDTVKKGCVISQDKKAGGKAEKGDKVTVVISKGVQTVKVPNVTGKKLSDATKALANAKLKYKVKKVYSSSVAKGKVIKQTNKGKKVKPNTVIVLTVSKGKKPQTTNSASQTTDYSNDDSGSYSDNDTQSYSSYESYEQSSSQTDNDGGGGELPTIAEIE